MKRARYCHETFDCCECGAPAKPLEEYDYCGACGKPIHLGCAEILENGDWGCPECKLKEYDKENDDE